MDELNFLCREAVEYYNYDIVDRTQLTQNSNQCLILVYMVMFGLHKRKVISCPAEGLLAFHEGPYFMDFWLKKS
jgi:hypothetical protein